jgi:Uma2 family endonuclease
MVLREKLYTVEEFIKVVQLPENDGKRLELDDGVMIDMGSSRRINTITTMRIGHFLNTHVIPKELGYVTGPDAGFKIGSRTYRQPDVAFITKEKLPDLKGIYFTIAPDLAVEVVSPDEDIFKKAREYLSAGTRMVWAVYADEKVVYVMRLDPDGSIRSTPFGVDAILDGGDVLPSFTLPVRDIFPS